MNIVVGAMFRDAAGYIARYFSQACALENQLREAGHNVRYVFAENDSSDTTGDLLRRFAQWHDVTLIDRSEGLPYWGSVDYEPRWRHIAHVCNGILEQLDPADDDVLLYVESDLVWEPTDMVRLVDAAGEGLVVGGMVFQGDMFYDIWGTRKAGIPFGRRYPWHPAFVGWEGGLMEVDSAAGATALPVRDAVLTRFGESDAYVGWCRSIRELGRQFWLDTGVRVAHP